MFAKSPPARELSSSGADRADARVGSVDRAMAVLRVGLDLVRLWLMFQWISAGAGAHGLGPHWVLAVSDSWRPACFLLMRHMHAGVCAFGFRLYRLLCGGRLVQHHRAAHHMELA